MVTVSTPCSIFRAVIKRFKSDGSVDALDALLRTVSEYDDEETLLQSLLCLERFHKLSIAPDSQVRQER